MLDAMIIYPCLAMVGITILVWIHMYVERIGEMRARGIQPQDIASSRQAAALLQNVKAAENFQNLFEVPVLFYTLCALLIATQSVSTLFVVGAWVFVVLRGLQSLVHCTYNHVMHRFILYVLSTLTVFALWGMFAIQILRSQH